jgi:hypothetical protein
VYGERWGVTTSNEFKARKFWREVMRPRAPARSGNARGRVGDAVVSMSSRRSQDQPGHAAAVLEHMATRNERLRHTAAAGAAPRRDQHRLADLDFFDRSTCWIVVASFACRHCALWV